jgi:hypothetical protein
MMAIFTSLKPSTGAAAEIQRRALDNWRLCFPDSRIITFEGPLVPFREMVEKVERETDADILMYANGDVLFEVGNVLTQRRRDSEYTEILSREKGFLLTGQRVDILADGTKRLHRPSGMDYFVFRRGMFRHLPRVLMGRAYCDCALVAYCLRMGIPVIDASFALRVEHQFHDYGHVKGGRTAVWQGEDAKANKRDNDLQDFGPHVLDATHTLLPDRRLVGNIRKRPKCWKLWHLVTRGGKWWKNPRWDGVRGI